MLGLLLGWMTYDTVKTVSNREKRKEEVSNLKARKYDLEYRLRKGMTKGHYYKCVCLLCVNRRKNAEAELATIQSKLEK